MASERNLSLTREMLGYGQVPGQLPEPLELTVFPDVPLSLSPGTTQIDVIPDLSIAGPISSDDLSLANMDAPQAFETISPDLPMPEPQSSEEIQIVPLPGLNIPEPDLDLLRHPSPPPDPELYDKDWIEKVMEGSSGGNRFTARDPDAIKSRVAAIGDTALAAKDAIREGVTTDEREQQFAHEIQSKIIRAINGLMVDNGYDYRLIDYLLSGFEMSRNTITDANG